MGELKTDRELLREFAECGSEGAFQSLVQRHVNLVFATALRGLGDDGMAQEVTQNVFIALARKAAWLQDQVALAGWLHKTALLEIRQRWRGELRRQRREQTAVELGTTMKDDDSLLESLTGILDEGLLELRETDRQALILRYLQDRTHREVGAHLGIGEDAARKRIDKALNELTRFFRHRGYAVPAAATTATLLRGASVLAVPAGIVAAVTKAGVSAGGAASLTTLGFYFAKFMGLTKTQTIAVCLIVVAAPVAYEWHAAATAQSEQKSLRIQIAQIQDDIANRQRALEQTQRRLRLTDSALGQLRANTTRPNVAAAIADDANGYLWDESSEFVRLPKQMLERLTLQSSHKTAEGRGSGTREPVSVRDGSLSAALVEALGVTPEEENGVGEAFKSNQHEYQRWDQGSTYITNRLPPGFELGHGLPFDHSKVEGQDARILVTAGFPEHGEILKRQLRSALESVLGKERTEVLWRQAEDGFRQRFNDFGALERWEAVALHVEDKRVSYTRGWLAPGEQHFRNYSGGHMPIDTARVPEAFPEAFRPLLAEWQNRFKSQPQFHE
jgi:RNA polymerase sigma factor (sigma-70 family)